MAMINNDNFDDDIAQRFIYTFEGPIEKKPFFDVCLHTMSSKMILDYQVPTLLAIYGYFERNPSEDTFEDPETGITYYPIRIMVIKSLMLLEHHRHVEIYLQASENKAAKVRRAAMDGDSFHQFAPVVFDEPVPCNCEDPAIARNVLICKSCDNVLCDDCIINLCPAALQGYIAEEMVESTIKEVLSSEEEDDTSDEEEEDSAFEELDLSFEEEDESSDEEELEVWKLGDFLNRERELGLYIEEKEEIEMGEGDYDDDVEIDVVGL